MIEDTASLERLVDDLSRQPVIGIDTEADSFHHYQEQVCLIQLSDLERDAIIDPLKVEDCSSLGRLLADPNIVKVLHGGDYDVVSLRRDFGFSFVNLFDTMIAALFLGMPRIGLADLIDRYFGYHIDKQYQRHDWSYRPLLEEHLQYARGDTHFLLALRDVLGHKLEKAGRMTAFQEECSVLAERSWSGRTQDPADFLRVKRSNTLDEPGLRVLRALWRYRDSRAKALDRPAFKVLADELMVALAQRRPSTMDDLHGVIRQGSTLARRYGPELLHAVEEGLADEEPLPTKTRSDRDRDRGPSSSRSGPGVEKILGALKAWRNDLVEREGLAPVVVANNQLLKDIAKSYPKTLEELAQIPGIRQWQLRDYGEQLLAVVQDIPLPTGATSATGTGKKRKRRRRSRAKKTE